MMRWWRKWTTREVRRLLAKEKANAWERGFDAAMDDGPVENPYASGDPYPGAEAQVGRRLR